MPGDDPQNDPTQELAERNRAELALRESETLYRSLFNNMLNGFAYCRMWFEEGKPRDFTYLAVNDAFESLTGLKNVVGKKVTEVIPGIRETDPQLLEIYGRVARSGQPERFEIFLSALQMWFSFSVYSPESEHFVAVFDVITERKQAEESLRQSRAVALRMMEDAVAARDQAEQANKALQSRVEERVRALQILHDSQELYFSLVENLPQSVFRKDRAGRFLFCNQRFCAGVGHSLEEIVGKTDADLFQPHLAEAYRRDDLLVMESGQTLDKVEEHSGVDGQKLFVQIVRVPLQDPSGGIIGVLGIFWDITPRKQAEERLRQQAALLDAATDAIYVCALDHTVTYWNVGAERLYGWTSAYAMGRKITELEFLDHEAAHAALLEKGSWSGELKKSDQAGTQRVMFCRWTLLRDEAGHPREVLAINTDITEKKQLEERFLRAQRLESVGQLAGGIAHDLNNILAPIMMVGTVLREELTNPHAVFLLDILERSAKRGADIIKQILTFSRGLASDRAPVQTRHLLKECIGIIRETFPKSITLKTSLPNGLWLVEGDATQLHQVLMNLLINARDAMPQGGTLTLKAENLVFDSVTARRNPGAKSGPYVAWQVSDTGMGIPPEILDRIFDPFFTTKEVGKGTGLGLSTVLGIVLGHGGFIQVDSRLGEGTVFRVYLPAQKDEILPEGTTDTTALEGRGQLILVVDDEERIRLLIKEALEKCGYRVVAARNGKEAIEMFTPLRGEIKLALVDLMMPLMDGVALCRVLLSSLPSLKIVVSSGMSDDAMMEELEHLGVCWFLPKPFTLPALFKMLADCAAGLPGNARDGSCLPNGRRDGEPGDSAALPGGQG
jgi:PAS domain S-box-containing protein